MLRQTENKLQDINQKLLTDSAEEKPQLKTLQKMTTKASSFKTEAIENTEKVSEREIHLIEERAKANSALFADLLTTIENNIETANQ